MDHLYGRTFVRASRSMRTRRTRSQRSPRQLDFIARINPRFGPAGHVEQVFEPELLKDAGSGAGAITAGADNRRLRIWFEIQARQQVAQLSQRRAGCTRRVSTVVFSRTAHVDKLKIGSCLD